MGLLDIPAPLFGWIDAQMGGLAPSGLRLALWGAFGGVTSMLLYRAISPQNRVARAKREIDSTKRALNSYDGAFAGAWWLMRRLLGLSVAQVGRVGWPALVASLPLLCLLSWISTTFGYKYPERGASPDIEIYPREYEAEWRRVVSDEPPHIVVRDNANGLVANVPLSAPVPLVHQRRWWNTLVANPAGYLPEMSALDSIEISLPRRQFLPFGYDWMRGWETAFFAPLLAASIAIKVSMRIE